MNSRLLKVINHMPSDFEALIISNKDNRFYVLNFDTHDAGVVVATKNEAYFIIDGRYIEIVGKKVKDINIVLQDNKIEQIKEILNKHNVKKVHIENLISMVEYDVLKNNLNCEIIANNELVNAMQASRVQKEDVELEIMYKAQEITDKAFEYMLTKLEVGKTEREMQLELDYFMLKNGADALAFDTILISGANTSLPHGVPTNKKIQEGDFVTMDFGAKVGGYCADMTRTVAMGYATDEMKKVYEIVLKAQIEGVKAVKQDANCKMVDKVCRDIISEAGYGDYFIHNTGHSVGIEIHEEPRFSPISKDELLENSAVTIEPGIYLPNKFGVRIEDCVIVNKNGCYVHGKTDKNLIIIK